MNSVQLFGYLTSDVELRYTSKGNPVANFGLALNRRYRQGDELKQETDFVDLTAFNRTAEVANEYLAKGRPVMIEGRLSYRAWGDRDRRQAFQTGSRGQSVASHASQRQERKRRRFRCWRIRRDGSDSRR